MFKHAGPRPLWRLRAVLGAAVLLSAGRLSAQSSSSAGNSGSVAGRVVAASSGASVPGAFVLIDGPRLGAQTGADGRFRVDDLEPGSHTIQVRRVGFDADSSTVTVNAGEVARLDFALTRASTLIAGVTVIGTKSDLQEKRARIGEVPGAVALIEPTQIRESRQANLKDVLRFTPGVYIQPRFGAADESQISVRGSGLRSNFHARGINLLVNGMPYRNADGFTDFESLELLTTESIEVYKGGNALRYGGSTLGGAINLNTKTGYSTEPLGGLVQGGSFGFYKAQVESGHAADGFDYYASYARTSLDGYRSWSGNQRDRVNLHAGYQLGANTDARAFYFFAHVKEHLPGSMTRASLEATPTAADPGNVLDRWGRDYRLHHIGVQLRTQLTPDQRLEVSPYVQYRDIDHPIYEVISQVSRDFGAEVRYENTAALFGLGNRFTLGAQPAYENMGNRQYQNDGGEHGPLTKNQKDQVRSLGLYAEDMLAVTPRLSAILGARFEYSTRESADHFLSNGDQSDRRMYRPFTPKVGFLYSLPAMDGQIFGNASRTFEPPLLLELNSLTVPGFIDLQGQSAWQYELGARGHRLGLNWSVAIYDVELQNEILNINVQPFPGATFTVPTYRNSPRTRHYGVETGLSLQLPGAVFVRGDVRDHLTLHGAYTFARYKFVDDSSYQDHDIPGAPSHHATLELRYTHPSGFSLAPSVEWTPQGYFVNSANTVRNSAWVTLGVRAEWAVPTTGMAVFIAGQNLTDRRYSGSVQVDNAAGKFFEPADGRSFYAGVRWNP